MKKLFSLLLTVCLMLSCIGVVSVGAEEASQLVPGPTAFVDETSATGYSATFVYEDADADAVKLNIGAKFYKTGQALGAVPNAFYSPFEWEDGMFGVGYQGYVIDLEKVEGTDFWSVTLPLPNALYQYNYLVEKDGEETTENDPANSWEINPDFPEDHDGFCTFYVPRDEEKQANSIDYTYYDPTTVENPGTVSYVTYTDANGDPAPLGVYLPGGYDADREEPYKVAFVSHGGGSYETNWFGCGALGTQFDHFIQDGTIEPTVLITINNTKYNWDFEFMMENLANNILPYAAENYNISTEQSDRAFFGISRGGETTCQVLYNCTEEFGYYGIHSGSYAEITHEMLNKDAIADVSIMLGCGIYDGLLIRPYMDNRTDGIVPLINQFNQYGISYGMHFVEGGHDWFAWPELVRIFVEDYLWK